MSGIEGLLHGRVLAGRYRIEEVIGRGGMGAVYRAMDERLGREVAVKVITVSAGGDTGARERLRARFHREARAAAALPHHPNVVPVYDYGTDEALELDFLVMELLRGEDLAALLSRSGRPLLTTGISILHGASRGVAVGHRSGLIHRDVKPGNIFLARGNGPDHVEVRVLDFGIAKLTAEEESDLTRDGRAPLSPAYASPEQLRGLKQLSPASDVFSLGAAGFQLLTGERPFTDLDRNRMSIGMPVSVPSLREHNPSIPPAIDEIVQRALAYDPADRWPDAGALADVLEQARRELGDAALPPYAPARLAGGVPRPATDRPPDDRTEFLDDRTLLDPGLHAADSAPVAEPHSAAPVVSPSRRRERRRERGGRGGGWRVGILATLILLAVGGAFAWWVTRESQPVVREVEPEPPPELPAIVPGQAAVEPDPPSELDAWINNQEGLRYYRQREYATALEQFRRAVAISSDNPEYRYNYALTLLQLGIPAEAAAELDRVIEQDPDRSGAYYNLAEAELALGDTVAAITALERVLDLSTDPRQQGITERRLREVRAAWEEGQAAVPADWLPNPEPDDPDAVESLDPISTTVPL